LRSAQENGKQIDLYPPDYPDSKLGEAKSEDRNKQQADVPPPSFTMGDISNWRKPNAGEAVPASQYLSSPIRPQAALQSTIRFAMWVRPAPARITAR
jgi:hypothetical protein